MATMELTALSHILGRLGHTGLGPTLLLMIAIAAAAALAIGAAALALADPALEPILTAPVRWKAHV
jgi:hypothetical protein